jgi:hypothetical protein
MSKPAAGTVVATSSVISNTIAAIGHAPTTPTPTSDANGANTTLDVYLV